MKKLLIFILLSTFSIRSQTIAVDGYTVIPQQTVSISDFVKILTHVTTNVLATKVGSLSVSVNNAQKLINLESCRFPTGLQATGMYVDTFSVGKLTQLGTYTVDFKAKLSSSHTVCVESYSDTETFTLQVVDDPVALVEKPEESRFIVYPNPLSDKLYVDFGDNLNGTMKLTIINTLGQSIYSKDNIRSKDGIETSFLPGGIYYLRIESEVEVRTIKISKV